MLKKYLISLDKDIQRRELFFSQKNTEDFQVFSAINTMQKDWDELATILILNNLKHIMAVMSLRVKSAVP